MKKLLPDNPRPKKSVQNCYSNLVKVHVSPHVDGEFPRLCKSLMLQAAPVLAYGPEANGSAEGTQTFFKILCKIRAQIFG